MAKDDSNSTLEVKIDAIKTEMEIHRESFKEHQRTQRDRYDDFKTSLNTILKQNEDIENGLADANEKLSDYNTQLQIHIQGVLQLKEMNQLLREEIKIFREKTDVEVKEINARLQSVEVPFKWADTTANFAEKAFTILKFIALLTVIFGGGAGIWSLIKQYV
jgi:hypothetical protein